MPAEHEVASFIRSTFRSVWTLELLCILRSDSPRSWTHAQMVVALRGSDLVVRQSVDALLATGLVVIDEDGQVRYQPASQALGGLADSARSLYAERPNAVRRMIVDPTAPSVAKFADAFKLRRDQ